MNNSLKEKVYDKNIALLRRYREGDHRAAEELCVLNTPLVYNIASRFSDRGVEASELWELGTIGLVKAINTFDLSRECAFSTYAVPLIFGEIRRFLRDDGMIKVSREEKRTAAILNAERERRLMSGESVGIRDIAEAVGISAEDAARAFFATLPPRSLDEAAFDDEDSLTLGATVFDEDEETKNFEKLALRFAIDELEDIEKKIIMLRYFKDYSQSDCARLLGLSQVKVSRMEKRLLSRLRDKLCDS